MSRSSGERIWVFCTLALIAACVAVPVVVVFRVSAGEVRMFHPLVDLLVGFAIWIPVFLETWRRIVVWRGRRGYWSKVYGAEVAREGKTSKAGSVIAWILLVPFVLLFIAMIAWMVVTLP
jgi:hypothetical protein